MRRKKVQWIKRTLAILLAFSCCISNSAFISLGTEKETRQYRTYDGNPYEVEFEVVSKWDGHFNGKMKIKNKGNGVIDDWNLQFRAAFTIENIYNAEIVEHDGNEYFIKNAIWNQDIQPNQEVEFGFTAVYSESILEPEGYKMVNYLTDMTKDNYEITYIEESDWGNGFTGAIMIKNTSTEIIEDWQLEFMMERKIEYFWSAELMEKKENYYHIKNAGFNANIKPGESLRIGIMGSQGKSGNKPFSCQLRHIEWEHFSQADTDRDGLTNEVELEIGSNPCKEDTDGDGLPDGYEVSELETNPCKVDSDGNGIMDDKEDFDEDGLTNMQEFEYETYPYEEDSDSDGLSDGEEVMKYQTDPMKEDTDGEGLKDGEDVKLGFSPLKKDTDGNGILDIDESSYQTVSLPVDEKETPGVTKVEVSFTTKGNIENTTKIRNMYDVDIQSSEVEGLVGVPVEIESAASFNRATITFTYDESALGATKEENLAVMWYDKENDWYEVLDEESVIDRKKNTVSLTTTHFSTYLLVDSEKWFQTWKNNPDYRGKYAYFDIAYAVDTSKSMKTNNRLSTAKKATKEFIDEQAAKDKGALITFGGTSKVVKSLGTSKANLKSAVNSLTLSEISGTDVAGGIKKSIKELKKGQNENRMLILICDGNVEYEKEIAEEAKKNKVKIFSVNIGYASSNETLKKYSSETGGEYFFCPSVDKVEAVYAELQGKTLDKIDKTDKDGDGLYDIYETNGMRLSNGKIIRTKTTKTDTDGDGLTDYEEAGFKYEDVIPKRLEKFFGKRGKKKVVYFNLYSNPTKKDTDKDGISDLKDPYPWHGYCGGRHAEWAENHKYELKDNGHYICKWCKKDVKSPELEDKDVLTAGDMQKVLSYTQFISLIAVNRAKQMKKYEPGRTEKLLYNEIYKIRKKKIYQGKYSYRDKKGNCIVEKFVVKGKVYTTKSKLGVFGKAMYSGVLSDVAGAIILSDFPWLSVLWSWFVELKINFDDNNGQVISVSDFINASFEAAKKKAKSNRITEVLLKTLGFSHSAMSNYTRFMDSSLSVNDDIITICVDRGKEKYGYLHNQTSKEFIFKKDTSYMKTSNLYWAALSPDDMS